MATGFVWDERFMWHQMDGYAGIMPSGGMLQPAQHFDHPDTKRRLKNLIEVSGLMAQLTPLHAKPAPREALERVHEGAYIDRVKTLSEGQGGETGIFAPIGPGGFDIANLCAGGALAAVDAVINGAVDNVYALLRPAGHHAEPDMGKGFCVFANASIAARHAQAVHGLGKIAIIDWDVHHGNGAQKIFWDDPSVLTLSIHQDRCFPPDSGMVDEIGGPSAEGFNINVPLPGGCGYGAYEAAFTQVVEPAVEAYKPDLIIVSSGLDAGGWDPLARMSLYSESFKSLTQKVMALADATCGGRLAVLHEGGYDIAMIPFMGLRIVETLSGISTGVEDPFAMIFAEDPAHPLRPHQQEVVSQAKAVVETLKAAL
ncbi:MAG: class II histone deacetylase [Pseudomonadota bacterium]